MDGTGELAEMRRGWRDRLDPAQAGLHQPPDTRLELDCDVLTTQHGDLRLVVYTAPLDCEAGTRLALLAFRWEGGFHALM